MLELAALAATVVGKFLVPLFTKGSDKLTDELAEKGGGAVANGLVGTAKSLWAKIKDRFDGDEERSVVTLFETRPEAQASTLEELLRERLATDDELRTALSELVEKQVEGTGEAAWRLMGEYVGVVDARGAKISGGVVAGVIVGPAPAPTPGPTSAPEPPLGAETPRRDR
jgi:hypothetical protein